jgi:hypothetical protein
MNVPFPERTHILGWGKQSRFRVCMLMSEGSSKMGSAELGHSPTVLNLFRFIVNIVLVFI